MRKNNYAKQIGFLKFYYVFIIVYAIMGFVDLVITIPPIVFWRIIALFFYLGVLALSIIAIVKFRKYRYSWYVFVLPILELIIYVGNFGVGVVSASLAFENKYLSETFINSFSWWKTLLVSTFELVLAIYVLRKMSK